MAVQSSIITRDIEKIAAQTGNIYESVVVISKRARQIAVNIKEELNNKLAEFATTVDNLEEVFENREQIEISKFYERMPKPTTTATEEFLEEKLNFRIRGEGDTQAGAYNPFFQCLAARRLFLVFVVALLPTNRQCSPDFLSKQVRK